MRRLLKRTSSDALVRGRKTGGLLGPLSSKNLLFPVNVHNAAIHMSQGGDSVCICPAVCCLYEEQSGLRQSFRIAGSDMLPTADVRSIYTGRRRSSECRPARSTALLTWLAKPSPALERKQPGQLRSTAPVRSRPDLRAKSVSGQDVQVRPATATASSIWHSNLHAFYAAVCRSPCASS